MTFQGSSGMNILGATENKLVNIISVGVICITPFLYPASTDYRHSVYRFNNLAQMVSAHARAGSLAMAIQGTVSNLELALSYQRETPVGTAAGTIS